MAMSVMVSEGKTTASDGCGSGLGQGLVQGGDKGYTRVQEKRKQGKSKDESVFGLEQGNVVTFGCNVATFQRGKYPTSRR